MTLTNLSEEVFEKSFINKLNWYFFKTGDYANKKLLSEEEIHQHLSEGQIWEAYEAKREDYYEEVCYMTVGGFVVLE